MTLARFAQSWNALSPMTSTLEGILTSVSADLSKTLLPIFLIPFSITTFVRLVQSWNVSSAIFPTLFGIVMLVKAVFEKAALPIFVTLAGMLIDVNAVFVNA